MLSPTTKNEKFILSSTWSFAKQKINEFEQWETSKMKHTVGIKGHWGKKTRFSKLRNNKLSKIGISVTLVILGEEEKGEKYLRINFVDFMKIINPCTS
jgi:hypothetical protein